MNDLDQLKKSSLRSAIISLIGIVIFIASLLFASYNLYTANKNLKNTQKELHNVSDSLKKEKIRISALKHDETQLNQYLIKLLNSTQINQGNPISSVNWDSIKSTIVNLPSGRRKLALTIALLTTWKEIPFELSKNSPKSSFDSPGYIQYVLKQVDINIERNPREPLSATLMKGFKKVDRPLPGDLVFYKGQVGSFGLIYLSPGTKNTGGIAIGTLQAALPLSIYNLDEMNTAYFPLIGYFRVNYE